MMLRAVTILLLLSVAGALAHDADHHPLLTVQDRNWFNGLTNQKGNNCCSHNDGSALADPDWEIGVDRYRVRINGEWIDVPPEAVVTQRNRSGEAWVWPYREEGGPVKVRCFMPGSSG